MQERPGRVTERLRMITISDIKRYKASLKIKKKLGIIDQYQAERNKKLRDINISVFLEREKN